MDKPHALPRRSDSYEKQLSDSELLWLHTSLLAGRPSLKQISAKMPPWREGRRMGQRISIAALHNIRERLLLEENFAEDGQTTESLLEQLRSEMPGISEEELDRIGTRTFTLLAIRRQDTKSFVKLRSAQNKAELERAKLQLAERAESRQTEALALDKTRFQRETCELFLKWSEDQRARDIAANGASNSEKIEALGQLLFEEDWKS